MVKEYSLIFSHMVQNAYSHMQFNNI